MEPLRRKADRNSDRRGGSLQTSVIDEHHTSGVSGIADAVADTPFDNVERYGARAGGIGRKNVATRDIAARRTGGGALDDIYYLAGLESAPVDSDGLATG